MHFPAPPPWHKDLFSVGVTGTNGKTSTTSFVAAALSRACSPVAMVNTIGFYVGSERLEAIPGREAFLTTMRRCLERGGRYAAVELTSEAMARGFIKSWPCRIGIFTNLTRDHFDAHKSAEHYLASKAQLFMHLPSDGAAVLNACDPSSELLAEVIPEGVRHLRYGVQARGAHEGVIEAWASGIAPDWEGTRFRVETGGSLGTGTREMSIRAIGAVFVENAVAAWLGAICAGVDPEIAAEAISELAPPSGRFEVVARSPGVVVDYAHTPDALSRTLETARQLCPGKLTVVFGAGGKRDREKRPMMGAAAAIADRVVLTSDNPRDEDPHEIAAAIRSGLAGHADVVEQLDREEAITKAVLEAGPDDVVLVAGKGHEVEQVIGGERRRFVDQEVIRSALRRR